MCYMHIHMRMGIHISHTYKDKKNACPSDSATRMPECKHMYSSFYVYKHICVGVLRGRHRRNQAGGQVGRQADRQTCMHAYIHMYIYAN